MASFSLFLQTDRLFLRAFTMADAPLLCDLDSDPEVMRYLTKGQPTPLECIVNEVLPQWMVYYERYDHLGYWAAHERASGAFIGWFHFRPDRYVPEDISLGYRLLRRFWGRGYATEGACALVDKAFTEWGVTRITARALAGNTASQRVMEKCGLRFEERYVYAGPPDWTEEERQAVLYALNREEYLSSRPGR